jgi:hypothetical protein
MENKNLKEIQELINTAWWNGDISDEAADWWGENAKKLM